MKKFAHQPRKRFGQNFLNAPHIIHNIVRTIHPQKEDNMVEIGPGLGALTQELLPLLSQLHVVELDRDLIPKLEKLDPVQSRLIIHQADALEFDFTQLASANKPLRIVGNLPYNISTPLLFHLLKITPLIKDMYFMLQKEVVDRIVAQPNSKTYGRLSIMIQYFCETQALFDVPPQCFSPPPKVNSAIVALKPYKIPPYQAVDFDFFTHIVRDAFNQRRKTLHNSLKKYLAPSLAEDLNLSLRPEQVSVAEFVKISNQLNVSKAS